MTTILLSHLQQPPYITLYSYFMIDNLASCLFTRLTSGCLFLFKHAQNPGPTTNMKSNSSFYGLFSGEEGNDRTSYFHIGLKTKALQK